MPLLSKDNKAQKVRTDREPVDGPPERGHVSWRDRMAQRRNLVRAEDSGAVGPAKPAKKKAVSDG